METSSVYRYKKKDICLSAFPFSLCSFLELWTKQQKIQLGVHPVSASKVTMTPYDPDQADTETIGECTIRCSERERRESALARKMWNTSKHMSKGDFLPWQTTTPPPVVVSDCPSSRLQDLMPTFLRKRQEQDTRYTYPAILVPSIPFCGTTATFAMHC